MRINLFANIVGQFWRAAMLLLFVPVYVRLLGLEAYGLIGILATLQVWLSLLDMGLRPALAREMARFVGGGRDGDSIWLLLRSIEVVVIALALIVFAGFALVSPWLARHWIHPAALSTATVATAFTVMGFVIATQLVEEVYTSSMVGLQRQVVQNVIATAAVTIRAVGAVAILTWVSRSVIAFFLWQGAVSLMSMTASAVVVHRHLPPRGAVPRFSGAAVLELRDYALGMIGIAVVSLMLTQVDKLLLSARLPLHDFGLYVLAGSVAGAMSMMTAPVGGTFFPRLTELVERDDRSGLVTAFHQAAQLLALMAGAAGLVIALFSERLLLAWTGDAAVARGVAPILSIMAVGTMFNALSGSMYALRSAFGWTSLTLRINLVGVLLVVPALWFVTRHFGGVGAAWVWMLTNGGILIAGLFGTFGRTLPGEARSFFMHDTLLPIAAMAVVATLCYLALPSVGSRIGEFILLMGIGALVLIGGMAVAPRARAFIALSLHRSPRPTVA